MFWRTPSELSTVSIASNESRNPCARTGLDGHQKLTRSSKIHLLIWHTKILPLPAKVSQNAREYIPQFWILGIRVVHVTSWLCSRWDTCSGAVIFFKSRFDTGCQSPSFGQGQKFFKSSYVCIQELEKSITTFCMRELIKLGWALQCWSIQPLPEVLWASESLTCIKPSHESSHSGKS